MAIPLKQIPFKSVVDELILVAPAVQLADIRAHSLARMLGSQLAHCVEVYLAACGRHVEQEVLCEGAVLNVLQDLLHGLLRLLGDDLRGR